MGENKKSVKNSFPSRGKSKNSEKRLSLTGENQKSVKNDFPSQGEIGKLRKLDKITFGVMFIF